MTCYQPGGGATPLPAEPQAFPDEGPAGGWGWSHGGGGEALRSPHPHPSITRSPSAAQRLPGLFSGQKVRSSQPPVWTLRQHHPVQLCGASCLHPGLRGPLLQASGRIRQRPFCKAARQWALQPAAQLSSCVSEPRLSLWAALGYMRVRAGLHDVRQGSGCGVRRGPGSPHLPLPPARASVVLGTPTSGNLQDFY